MRLSLAPLVALAVLVACAPGCRSSTPFVPTRDAGLGDTGPGPGGACADDLDCSASETSDPEGRRCVSGGCGCLEDLDCRGLPGVRGPFCDPVALGCVACLASGDCIAGGIGAVCVDGRCEGCRTSADCTSPGAPVCAEGACVGCATSADCAASSDGAVCDEGVCGCATSTDCAGGRVCEAGRCVPPCATDADCTDGILSSCDPTRGECVMCLEDADCAGSAGAGGPGARCLVATRTCGCEDDTHCTRSDDGRHCDAPSATCGCRDASGCPAERPVCERWCRTMPIES
jgi:hypothetical protein